MLSSLHLSKNSCRQVNKKVGIIRQQVPTYVSGRSSIFYPYQNPNTHSSYCNPKRVKVQPHGEFTLVQIRILVNGSWHLPCQLSIHWYLISLSGAPQSKILGTVWISRWEIVFLRCKFQHEEVYLLIYFIMGSQPSQVPILYYQKLYLYGFDDPCCLLIVSRWAVVYCSLFVA